MVGFEHTRNPPSPLNPSALAIRHWKWRKSGKNGKKLFLFYPPPGKVKSNCLILIWSGQTTYQNLRKRMVDFINLNLEQNNKNSIFYWFLSGLNTFSPLNPRDIPGTKKFQLHSRALIEPELVFLKLESARAMLRGSKWPGPRKNLFVPHPLVRKPAVLGPQPTDSHSFGIVF
jgi:hypothetical protein